MTHCVVAGYKFAELQCYAHAYAIMAAAGKWQRRCLMMSALTSCHCDPRIPRWPVLSNKRRKVGPDLTVPPRASIGTSPSCIFPPRSRNQNPSTMTTASWYQARKLIGLQKALEPGVKGGVYQAVILPGLAIPSPHISPRRTTFCPPSPISRRPQGLPRLQQLGCNALLPPTWWYRSPSDVCQALVALSMPVRHAGETLLCRGDSGTRIAPIFDSGAGNAPLSGCRRRCVDASPELGIPSKTLKLFMPTTTQEEANLQPKRGQDIVILGEDDNTDTFLQTSLQTERNWSEQERMMITTILRNTTFSQDL